nr:zinc finger, CCHC-type, retrotransposon Gag domain protein [Tanacetum cinerariifolium]
MVNTCTDAELVTAVQNALQRLLPKFAQRFARSSVPILDPVGTAEEQAKNFQWGLHMSTLNHLMCISFTNVAQVTNAARNYEILHERDDDGAERPDKRQKSGDQHQPTTQQSSHRNHGHNNERHGSDWRGGGDNHRSNNNYSGNKNKSSGNRRDQRNRGQHSTRPLNSGFQQSRGPSEGYSYPKDCKKNTTASTSGQADKKPGASGRVFAITEDHATKTS